MCVCQRDSETQRQRFSLECQVCLSNYSTCLGITPLMATSFSRSLNTLPMGTRKHKAHSFACCFKNTHWLLCWGPAARPARTHDGSATPAGSPGLCLFFPMNFLLGFVFGPDTPYLPNDLAPAATDPGIAAQSPRRKTTPLVVMTTTAVTDAENLL